MLKGGVIMDVVNPQEAKIAEEAGAVAVMALERVPSDIRRDGGVARMSDPEMDLAMIARGQGAEGLGPVTRREDLAPTIAKAISLVDAGKVCLVDIRV